MKNPIFSMDKRSSYVILFNSRRWIHLMDQILLFIILIRFSIIRMQFIPLNLQESNFYLYGIRSRVIAKQKKTWDYGSQYSRIYCYCTVHSSSYCLFTYHLRKNSQSKWLIWLKLELLLLQWLKKWKNGIPIPSLKWKMKWSGWNQKFLR